MLDTINDTTNCRQLDGPLSIWAPAGLADVMAHRVPGKVIVSSLLAARFRLDRSGLASGSES